VLVHAAAFSNLHINKKGKKNKKKKHRAALSNATLANSTASIV
jgi:hypothetical protein